MDEILAFDHTKRINYYELLGCSQHSNVEQINKEFKLKALKLHPDKNSNDEKNKEKFQMLAIAKEILLDPVKRKLYDTWLNSGLSMSFEQFSKLNKSSSQNFHWSTKKAEPMITISLNTDECYLNDSNVMKQCNINPSYINSWRQDTSDEILRKFRNYEI